MFVDRCLVWLVFWAVVATPIAADPDPSVLTLDWEGDAGAQRYAVTVIHEDGTPVLQQEVEDPSLTLTLPPGSYRYQIQVYNLLDQVETSSAWGRLVVLAAQTPAPQSVEPSVLFLEDSRFRVTVRGALLLAGATFELSDTTSSLIPVVSESMGDHQAALSLPETLVPGEYSVTVTNPGGLKATLAGALVVRSARPWGVRVSTGWSPTIVLYDAWSTGLWAQGFYPLGAVSRLDSLFLKGRGLQGGLGLDLEAWGQPGALENVAIESRFFRSGVSALSLVLVSPEFRLGARVGGGLLVSHHQFSSAGQQTASWLTANWYVSGDLAVVWAYDRSFFVEGGLEGLHGFYGSFALGLLKPQILWGYQF